MKKTIYEIIKRLTDERRKAKLFPLTVQSISVYREFQKEFPDATLDDYKKAVNGLIGEKKLSFGESVNDIYLQIKN